MDNTTVVLDIFDNYWFKLSEILEFLNLSSRMYETKGLQEFIKLYSYIPKRILIKENIEYTYDKRDLKEMDYGYFVSFTGIIYLIINKKSSIDMNFLEWFYSYLSKSNYDKDTLLYIDEQLLKKIEEKGFLTIMFNVEKNTMLDCISKNNVKFIERNKINGYEIIIETKISINSTYYYNLKKVLKNAGKICFKGNTFNFINGFTIKDFKKFIKILSLKSINESSTQDLKLLIEVLEKEFT